MIRKRSAFASLVALATLALLAPGASAPSRAASDNPFSMLSGTWKGWGWIELWSGDKERLRCKVVYKVSGRGKRASQALLCASTSYKVDARGTLRISAGRVSGTWAESGFGVEGSVSGTAKGKMILLGLVGAKFTAAMAISVDRCRQTVTIKPRGLEVRKVSMGLKKC